MSIFPNNPQGGLNQLVLDVSQAWAASAAVNTSYDIAVAAPALWNKDGVYVILVTNPSTVTDLTVIVKNKVTLGGSPRYPELTRVTIPKNSADGKALTVQGWLLPEGGRITISNDTALGAGQGFTAYIHSRGL